MTPLVIYCDASVPLDRPDADAGWGAVIIAGNRVVEASGTFPQVKGTGSSICELRAAFEALDYAVKHRLARHGAEVIIASDCQAVEEHIERTPRRPCRVHTAVAVRVRRLARERGLRVTVCRVKGHNIANAETDPHAVYNSRADKLARVACGVRRS